MVIISFLTWSPWQKAHNGNKLLKVLHTCVIPIMTKLEFFKHHSAYVRKTTDVFHEITVI